MSFLSNNIQKYVWIIRGIIVVSVFAVVTACASENNESVVSHDENTEVCSDSEYKNPVLEKSGDPFTIKINDKYYLYLPEQNGNRTGGKVICYTSTNLVDWEKEGTVYENTDHSYDGQETWNLWAPEVMEINGKYYLYVVNVMTNPSDDRVGDKDIVVIEGESPLSFDKSTRKVLLDDAYAFIDPSPFKDPNTDELFLYYKRRGAYGTGSQIYVHPMSSPNELDGTSKELFHSDNVPNAANVLEHPDVHFHEGKYFLFFSKNSGKKTNYAISYAVGNDPLGPFDYKEALFHSDFSGPLSQQVISPGGSSIVLDGSGNPWIVYRQKSTTETTFGDRIVCINQISFNSDQEKVSGEPSRGVCMTNPMF